MIFGVAAPVRVLSDRSVEDPPGSGEFAPARCYQSLKAPWKGPGLTMSRALGDIDGARIGMLPTPETSSRSLDRDADLYLIIASDGVWEFLSNEQAVEIVHAAACDGVGAHDACKRLILKAAQEWHIVEGEYRDDISAIVVYLPELIATLASTAGEAKVASTGSEAEAVVAEAASADPTESFKATTGGTQPDESVPSVSQPSAVTGKAAAGSPPKSEPPPSEGAPGADAEKGGAPAAPSEPPPSAAAAGGVGDVSSAPPSESQPSAATGKV